MTPIAFREDGLIIERPSRPPIRMSPQALGVVGLGSGLSGLVAVWVGMGSWMVLGAAFVIWCFSGWRLFFADSSNERVVRVLGYVFLSTGLLVVAGIVLKLYLVALGPPWIL